MRSIVDMLVNSGVYSPEFYFCKKVTKLDEIPFTLWNIIDIIYYILEHVLNISEDRIDIYDGV